jgi:LmbE family N-acetylglucosaminyl deacetylase
VGGTLLRHKARGDDVTVVLMAECRPESTRESFAAASEMSMEYVRWPDDLDALVRDADTVYTHSLADLHADHRSLHERVLVACRPYSAPSVTALYAFETPSATDWGMVPFRPTLFVDITATLERKLDAMRAYRSELRVSPHPRSITGLETRAAYWGQHAGYEYAEAFEVIRERW